ncbi:MAG: hypothetical protein Ct9H90mP16_06330 [Candidatus Poseidoniales archaeon]|nr:MAG: hypothetical protein Ct9H90mP16_06330 [Candidatus Poseidoniales archaeon]
MVSLNVPSDEMKGLLRNSEDGIPVWRGCESVRKWTEKGILGCNLFNVMVCTVLNMAWTKRTDSTWTDDDDPCDVVHGSDVVDGKPRRWRVENSWGEDSDKRGITR